MSDMNTAPKKNNTLRNLLIGGCAVLLACAICGGIIFAVTGGAILGLVNGPALSATVFIEALKTKNYDAAYSVIHPEQQAAFGGSASGLQSTVEGMGLANISDYKFGSVNVTNDQGVVTYTATVDGASKDLRVDMKQDGKEWKVIGFGPSNQ
jgi:hypothetical protein